MAGMPAAAGSRQNSRWPWVRLTAKRPSPRRRLGHGKAQMLLDYRQSSPQQRQNQNDTAVCRLQCRQANLYHSRRQE